MTETNNLVTYQILIIEDDSLLADMFKKVLSNSGYEVTTVFTGEDGLARLEQSSYDLIFLDIMMPGMSGFEVLKAVRTNQKTKLTPIIILSNLSDIDNMEHGLRLGATDYAIKANMDIKHILSLTDKHLVHRNARVNTRQEM